MTEQQELALYRVVFSLPHHQRRLALARKIIEQGGPLTPARTERREGDHANTPPMKNKGPF